MPVSAEKIASLNDAARAANARAYAPYSRFPVGAAVLTASGEIFSGCNVENASYGLGICAERNAVFAAVAAGHRRLLACALYVPGEKTITPCGACRQVLREFGATMEIVSTSGGGQELRETLDALLPHSFGPESLGVSET
jgi:cytidine deaminase